LNNFLKKILMPVLTGFALLLAVACGPSVAPNNAPEPVPDHKALNSIVATNTLEVGEQRIAFLLATPNGVLKAPSALVTPFYMDGNGSPSPTMEAQFNLWPYGIRGSYTTYASFDRPGLWRLDVQVDNPDGEDKIQIKLKVLDKSPVPAVGSVALLSETKTLATHEVIEEITTDYSPDPDLYQLSIKEAVQNSLPSVVVFASPAFCTSPTCGPQVDILSELKEKRPGLANYIHVEIYDNPTEIQGDLDRAEIFGVVDDWGLTSIADYLNESWTFIVDANGKISDRFEGFATAGELETALMRAISQT
jgi:hypothetical protein